MATKRGRIVGVVRVGSKFAQVVLDSGAHAELPLELWRHIQEHYTPDTPLVCVERRGRVFSYVHWAGTEAEAEEALASSLLRPDEVPWLAGPKTASIARLWQRPHRDAGQQLADMVGLPRELAEASVLAAVDRIMEAAPESQSVEEQADLMAAEAMAAFTSTEWPSALDLVRRFDEALREVGIEGPAGGPVSAEGRLRPDPSAAAFLAEMGDLSVVRWTELLAPAPAAEADMGPGPNSWWVIDYGPDVARQLADQWNNSIRAVNRVVPAFAQARALAARACGEMLLARRWVDVLGYFGSRPPAGYVPGGRALALAVAALVTRPYLDPSEVERWCRPFWHDLALSELPPSEQIPPDPCPFGPNSDQVWSLLAVLKGLSWQEWRRLLLVRADSTGKAEHHVALDRARRAARADPRFGHLESALIRLDAAVEDASYVAVEAATSPALATALRAWLAGRTDEEKERLRTVAFERPLPDRIDGREDAIDYAMKALFITSDVAEDIALPLVFRPCLRPPDFEALWAPYAAAAPTHFQEVDDGPYAASSRE